MAMHNVELLVQVEVPANPELGLDLCILKLPGKIRNQGTDLGCFTSTLSYIQTPKHYGWTAESQVKGNIKWSTGNEWYDRKADKWVHSPQRQYIEGYLLSMKKEIDEAFFEQIVAYFNHHGLYTVLIGDTLSRDERNYDTCHFVEYLCTKGIGAVTCGPATYNKNYPNSQHLCQVWIWTPPAGTPFAMKPRTVVHGYDKLQSLASGSEVEFTYIDDGKAYPCGDEQTPVSVKDLKRDHVRYWVDNIVP